MQISFRLRNSFLLSAFVLGLLCLPAASARAQTLARPNWAGSGLTHEDWWQNAVFYRIRPQDFQDSNGDGKGDLQGVAARMDYLQSLGVDAILLEPPFNDDGFDDLLTEASHRHIRIIVGLDTTTAENTEAAARSWLTRGAAGVAVTALHPPESDDPDIAAGFLHQLRVLTQSLPGERVLMATEDAAAATPEHGRFAEGAELVEPILGLDQGSDNPSVALFRSSLLDRMGFAEGYLRKSGERLNARAAAAEANSGSKGDLQPGYAKAVATMLLATRGGVILQYGQEIGTNTGGKDPVMQWTPSNFTKPEFAETAGQDAAPKPPPPPKPQASDVYGAYVPYVRPKKKAVAHSGGAGGETVPAIDPDSLRGFSSEALPATDDRAADHAKVNVAVEDATPDSLLNFYRRLIQLHHGNASLRTGTPYALDFDAQDALVWVRRAPAGARTVATVIVACNLSGKSLVLALTPDLEHLRMRPGTLRPLLASDHADAHDQTTNHLTLAPHAVFIGEIYHR